MARFQAQTNAVLDRELETLRERLGLRANQKADLLRELAVIGTWVVQQSAAGRKVEARSGEHVEALEHPTLERLRSGASFAAERVVLYGSEQERLADLLLPIFFSPRDEFYAAFAMSCSTVAARAANSAAVRRWPRLVSR